MEYLISNIRYIDNILYIPQELFNVYDICDIELVLYNKFGLNQIPEQYFEISEKRSGQSEFRQNIIKRDKYCIITNSHPDMCEACHIIPYNECTESTKYNINNGLLLESGIHKLFDKYLWSINPTTQKIEVSSKLLNDTSYELINKYNGVTLNLSKDILVNLTHHYKHILCKKI